ncbi:MAG: peptide ABC transporter substrate-binding protein, partial [Pyrinomonadaceae bacterium]|nr:peptide ABC transporter substrate-binding protein [Phycisphaerales bacterium]
AAQFQLISGAAEFYAWRERGLRALAALDSIRSGKIGTLSLTEKEPGPAAQALADLIWYLLEGHPAQSSQKPSAGGGAMLRWNIDRAIIDRDARRNAAPGAQSPPAPTLEDTQMHWSATLQLAAQLADITENFRTDLFQMPEEAARAQGAKLWAETERAFDSMVRLKAVNDHELAVTLVRPTPYFLDLCSFAVFYPVYPPLVRQYELPDPRTGRLDLQQGWTKPPLIVSNGPFELKIWRFKRDMRFEKNPHYWNKDAINIDSIMIPSVEDPNAQILTYDSGGVDWISDVTPSYRADMLAEKQKFYKEHQAEYDAMVAQGLDPVEIDRRLPPDPRKRISVFPAFGTYFYNFNCLAKLPDGRDNPFADPKVRRAFAMAIDREHIARDVRRVGERPTSRLVPPDSIQGYVQPQGLKYDPAAARALLAEAGYPGGKGMMTIEILYNKDSGHDVIAQAVARDWQENLGVPVTLAQKEIKVFRDDLKNHNFMVSRAGWYGDYGDPTTFLDLSRTGDGNNDRAYSSKPYDSLLDEANGEADAAKRLEILSRAEKIIIEEDLPLVPIFNYVNVYMFDPNKLTGISSHPRQEQNIYLIDIFGDGKGTDSPRSLPPAPPAPATPGVDLREGRP